MGLLDIFKKKSKNIPAEVKESKPFNVSFDKNTDGKLQLDFYDREADFKQFYDTTRLVISDKPLNIAGQEVYNCQVSWYGHDDCQMLDETTGKFESPSSREYENILVQLDLNLLQSDSNYYHMVMKRLLDKKRVTKYLEAGLQETPEKPCGNYIGGIRKTEKGYNKFFSIPVGKAVHDSISMINTRKKHRAKIEAFNQRKIENKRAQLKKLEEELDTLSK